MPRIPTYTAGESQRRALTTVNLPPVSGNVLGAIATNVGRDIINVATIHARLEDQQDRAGFLVGRSKYEAGIKEIGLNVANDPASFQAPDSYLNLFKEQSRVFANDLVNDETLSPGARGYLKNYITGRQSIHNVEARAAGQKLFINNQRAMDDVIGDLMSQTAAEAPTQEMRQFEMAAFRNHLQEGVARKIYSPGEAEKKYYNYEVNTTAKSMAILGSRDPAQLFARTLKGDFNNVPEDRRAKILDTVSRAIEHADTQLKKLFNEKKASEVNNLWGRANSNEITQQEETDLLAGKNQYVDAHQARAMVEANQNPLSSGEGSLAVRSLEQLFHLEDPGSPDNWLGKIRQYRKQLNEISTQIGRPSKLVNAFANELQNEENRAQAEQRALAAQERAQSAQERALSAEQRAQAAVGRAERGEERTVKKDVTQAALEDYNSQMEPFKRLLGPRIGGMMTAQENIDRAEIRKGIRNGEDPTELVKRVIQRHRTRSEKQPEGPSKTIQELVPRNRR